MNTFVFISQFCDAIAAAVAGKGAFRVRARWSQEDVGRGGWQIVVTEITYMVQKSKLIEKLAAIELHFWIATIGIVLYIASMWVNGITQGLMWRAINDDGTLTYSFVEGLQASHPGYIVRALGGAIFASGMLFMAYNVFRTVTLGRAVDAQIPAVAAHAHA